MEPVHAFIFFEFLSVFPFGALKEKNSRCCAWPFETFPFLRMKECCALV